MRMSRCGAPRHDSTAWSMVSLVLVLLFGLACATTGSSSGEIVREVLDGPEVFMVQQAGILSRVPGTSACLSPLFDPRDHAQIVLSRSRDGLGDYEVGKNRYGMGRGELLRIDCRTGAPVGIVRR